MLENEPEGGERTGSQPASETADQSSTADRAVGTPPTTAVGSASVEPAGPGDAADAEAAEPAPPARRTRATRRRAAPLNQPEQTDAPVEAPTGGAGSAESPQAEVFAPVSGDLDVAPKTPRRRRKATAVETTAEEPLVAASAEQASAEVVPPVKVTRTRRKKATPAAVEEPPAAADEVPAVEEPVAVEEPAASDLREAEAELTETDAAPSATAPGFAWSGGAQESAGEVPPGVAVPGVADEPNEPAEVEPEQPRTRRRRAALSAPTVLFMAPQPDAVPVTRPAEPAAVAEEPAVEEA
ncbi:ribonuclease E/G, partial [Micromonospora sp. STR1s_6]|nr:ribonuclease E/G [Micromonospora tarensis]